MVALMAPVLVPLRPSSGHTLIVRPPEQGIGAGVVPPFLWCAFREQEDDQAAPLFFVGECFILFCPFPRFPLETVILSAIPRPGIEDIHDILKLA
jgi:hypothetical protein